MAAFHAWLEAPATQAQMRVILPEHIPLPSFIAAAKTAVMTNPQLLKPEWRGSLLEAVTKAAAMGLIPDGKQGVLVPRYDDRAKDTRIAWQPMVWGIVRLGRLTGAIRSIRPVIVFLGENFEIDETTGDVVHRRGANERKIVDEAYAALQGSLNQWGRPEARVDAFMERIDCVYCIIEASDGTRTVRWMSAERLQILRATASAKGGPWAGLFVDEMCLKAVILYTAKHIDLDVNNAATGRFRAAIEADMDVDFEALDAPAARAAPAALPAPGAKIGTLEDMLAGGATREKVSVERGDDPFDADHRGVHQLPPDRAPADREELAQRQKFASGCVAVIAEIKTHKGLHQYRTNPSFAGSYAVLREENPALAKLIDDALAATTQRLGPPSEHGDA